MCQTVLCCSASIRPSPSGELILVRALIAGIAKELGLAERVSSKRGCRELNIGDQ